MEDAAKDIVVVKEVAPTFGFAVLEGTLHLREHFVDARENTRPDYWGPHTGAQVNDLQPLLNVHLHP